MEQSLMEKLTILADSAKYDVACTSSGASRAAKAGSMGSCYAPGCCHAFTADGHFVRSIRDVQPGASLTVKIRGGEVDTRVTAVRATGESHDIP